MSDKEQQDQQQQPEVRMRGNRQPLSSTTNGNAQTAVLRGLDILQEGEVNEETEEIRKLDSQLDHLNDYMTKMEQRLKEHNEKMMATLKQQREEREKRRRSFHERMTQNQAEDTDFQNQMRQILSRVSNERNRQSVFDLNVDAAKVESSS